MKETLLEFIARVEAAHFQIRDDTNANSVALFIWNLVREHAGLKGLRYSELPRYCTECGKYHALPLCEELS